MKIYYADYNIVHVFCIDLHLFRILTNAIEENQNSHFDDERNEKKHLKKYLKELIDVYYNDNVLYKLYPHLEIDCFGFVDDSYDCYNSINVWIKFMSGKRGRPIGRYIKIITTSDMHCLLEEYRDN